MGRAGGWGLPAPPWSLLCVCVVPSGGEPDVARFQVAVQNAVAGECFVVQKRDGQAEFKPELQRAR